MVGLAIVCPCRVIVTRVPHQSGRNFRPVPRLHVGRVLASHRFKGVSFFTEPEGIACQANRVLALVIVLSEIPVAH